MGRVPPQVFPERNGHRTASFPARFEETVVEDESGHPTPSGHRADYFVAQVPVRRGQLSGVRVRRAHAGKPQVQPLPYAFFGEVRDIPDES